MAVATTSDVVYVDPAVASVLPREEPTALPPLESVEDVGRPGQDVAAGHLAPQHAHAAMTLPGRHLDRAGNRGREPAFVVGLDDQRLGQFLTGTCQLAQDQH